MKINNLSLAFLFSGIINLALGLFVYVKGKKKLSNRLFTIFTAQLFIWCFISFLIASVLDVKKSEFLVRLVFAYTSFIPSTFCAFAFSLGEDKFPRKNIRILCLFYILSLTNALLSFSPNFIKEIYLISPFQKGNIKTGPMVKYGKLELSIFTINIILILVSGLVYLYRKRKTKTGITALEIQYVFLAVLFGTIYEMIITLIPILFEFNVADRLGPFATVIISATMVYGIARYKIMDISWVYERFTLYFSLSIVLFLIFISSNFLLKKFGEFFLIKWGNFPLFFSCFFIALLFNPVRERLERFLRVKILKYDVELFSQKIFDEAFVFIDLPSLFKKLGDLIEEFLNVPPEMLLLIKKERNLQLDEEFPNVEIKFSDTSLILKKLERTKILIREEEKRFEAIYPDMKEVVDEFDKYGYEVAIGLARRGEILGALFLKKKKDGKIFTFRDQMLLSNLGPPLGIILENIELYNQISKANNYIRNLLDNSPFGVISLDREGKIYLVSKQMKFFLEKEEEDLFGKDYKEVFPSRVISMIEEKYRKFDRKIITEEIIYKKGKKNLIMRVNVVPLYDERSKEIGIMVIFVDETKVRQLQEEIKEKEKFASLGVMAAGLAHEIKNPLVAIKTFVDLLPSKYNDMEFIEFYPKILHEEINRINNLIEQILLFARPQITKIEDVNLNEIINSTIAIMNFRFSEKSIRIIKDLPQENVIIKGDSEKLKQVFLNIFMNSFEAINHKEGVIEVGLREENEKVEILISDNGYGIKKEIINKIFDPFFTTKEKGTGLGLSIVLRIVEEHKGKVRVESEENKGTKVFIELPKTGVFNEASSISK